MSNGMKDLMEQMARYPLGDRFTSMQESADDQFIDTFAALSEGIVDLVSKITQKAYKESGKRLNSQARKKIGRAMYDAAVRELSKL